LRTPEFIEHPRASISTSARIQSNCGHEPLGARPTLRKAFAANPIGASASSSSSLPGARSRTLLEQVLRPFRRMSAPVDRFEAARSRSSKADSDRKCSFAADVLPVFHAA
jgi:hypothetical protein